MKITKSYLKNIIKEELNKLLKEQVVDRPKEQTYAEISGLKMLQLMRRKACERDADGKWFNCSAWRAGGKANVFSAFLAAGRECEDTPGACQEAVEIFELFFGPTPESEPEPDLHPKYDEDLFDDQPDYDYQKKTLPGGLHPKYDDATFD